MNSVFIDTAPLIYLLEGTPERRAAVQQQLHQWIEAETRLLSSTLTLMELLVLPIRQGNSTLEKQYRHLLPRLFSVPLLAIDESTAALAAEFRASYGLRAVDALQLAGAVNSGCNRFYTNDLRLRRFDRLEIVAVTAEHG